MSEHDRGPIQNICILGKHLHVASVAAALSRKFMQQNINIIAVNTEGNDKSVYGEASLSALHYFHRFLGLKEHQMMAVTSATYKLASQYKRWSCSEANDTSEKNKHSSFYHSLSSYGSMIDSIAFVHHLTKLRQNNKNYDFTCFSLPAVMARNGKFAKPESAQSALPYSYAMHIDATSYAKGMQDYATKLGVKFISSNIDNVQLKYIENNLGQPSAHVKQVTLSDGRQIKSELFIDCTSDGELIDKALNVGFEDWSEYLPCDRFLTCKTELDLQLQPSTNMNLHKNGWERSFPLQNGTVKEFFYSSKYLSDDEAVKEFEANHLNDTKILSECRIEKQRTGRRKQFFSGNCVSMGGAAGSLDRLAVSDFHLVQSAVLRLIDLFPDTSLGQFADNFSRNEYNHLSTEEYARILDYHGAHFAIPAKEADESCSQFWQAQKTAILPDSLVKKFNLFEACGRIPFYERETFSSSTWVSLLLGLGMHPKSYDVLLDMPPASNERSIKAINNIMNTIKDISDRAPSHAQYLRQYCVRRNNR